LYPSFGNLVPRDVACRRAKEVCDNGYGVGPTGLSVYLDFRDSLKRLGRAVIDERYGNLFEMYERITAENPYEVPMRIYPAIHYMMGGLWVDYNLMSTIPGLFVLGEANFSDHGANRLGASALMQGLADGYFIIPYTISDYLVRNTFPPVSTDHSIFKNLSTDIEQLIGKLLSIKGKKTVTQFHKELGKVLWEYVGMARSEAGLNYALEQIPRIREEFWNDVIVSGDSGYFNKYLEYALRVADYLELGELIATDALHRRESCGCHLRDESQTEDGEAKRDDEHFKYVAAWEYKGAGNPPLLNKEPLEFKYAQLAQRSYK